MTYFEGHPVDSFGGDQMTRHFLKIMLPFTLVFFVFSGLDGFLVFDSVWDSGSVVEVIGGAVLLAFGFVCRVPHRCVWLYVGCKQHGENMIET